MKKISSSCDTSSSSMLEFGKDGILRYFARARDGEREEKWSIEGGDGGDRCELDEECDEDECACDNEATFVKDGTNWFVEMDGIRTSLNEDDIRDFAPEDE